MIVRWVVILTILGFVLAKAATALIPSDPPATDRSEPIVISAPPKPRGEPIGNGYASFTVRRAADNHYYAEGEVNGVKVRFIVDTGATSVVLTREDALRAGISGDDFNVTGRGAGGAVRLMPTTIARLSFGPLTADQVPALVAERDLPVSLLGQSYLARVGSVSISGDVMTLR